jgi:hypothetical protein
MFDIKSTADGDQQSRFPDGKALLLGNALLDGSRAILAKSAAAERTKRDNRAEE